jgi:hypothetical protein
MANQNEDEKTRTKSSNETFIESIRCQRIEKYSIERMLIENLASLKLSNQRIETTSRKGKGRNV